MLGSPTLTLTDHISDPGLQTGHPDRDFAPLFVAFFDSFQTLVPDNHFRKGRPSMQGDLIYHLEVRLVYR